MKVAFSSLSVPAYPVPKRKSKTTSEYKHTSSGKYGLKNHFWPLESGFLIRKNAKKGPNLLGPLLPILRLEFLELSCNSRQFGGNIIFGYFSIRRVFRIQVSLTVKYPFFCDSPMVQVDSAIQFLWALNRLFQNSLSDSPYSSGLNLSLSHPETKFLSE